MRVEVGEEGSADVRRYCMISRYRSVSRTFYRWKRRLHWLQSSYHCLSLCVVWVNLFSRKLWIESWIFSQRLRNKVKWSSTRNPSWSLSGLDHISPVCSIQYSWKTKLWYSVSCLDTQGMTCWMLGTYSLYSRTATHLTVSGTCGEAVQEVLCCSLVKGYKLLRR